MTQTEEILEVVRELPGRTVGEIMLLLPQINQSNMSSMLSQLTRRGKVRREIGPRNAGGQTPYIYFIGDGTPQPVKRKLTKPTPVAMAHNADALRRELDELRKWKADAIARYPDLAVPPLVIKARQLYAAQLNGNAAAVSDVRAGKMDDGAPMRAIIAALELAE